MAVVLDTCVISELERARPEPAVVRWLETQSLVELYLTTVVVAELCSGAERLGAGRRRDRLTLWIDDQIDSVFAGRILPLDLAAARVFGRLTGLAFAAGRPPGMLDAQIAAVAVVHGMTVATRDTGDFTPFGVPLIDPWTAA